MRLAMGRALSHATGRAIVKRAAPAVIAASVNSAQGRNLVLDRGRGVPYFNSANRRAFLLQKSRGQPMFIGEEQSGASSPSWASGLLDFAKSAAALVNQQRSFNQQMSIARSQGVPVTVVQQAPAPVAARPQTNWTRIALLGGAAALSVVLVKSIASRRR